MAKKGRKAFDNAARAITYPTKSVRRDWPQKIMDSFSMGINKGWVGGGIIDHPFTVVTEDGEKFYCVETYSRLDSGELMAIREFCMSVGFDYRIEPSFAHWNPESCTCIAFYKMKAA